MSRNSALHSTSQLGHIVRLPDSGLPVNCCVSALFITRRGANNIVSPVLGNLVFLSPSPDEIDARFFLIVRESKLAVRFLQSKQIQSLWRDNFGQLTGYQAQYHANLEQGHSL